MNIRGEGGDDDAASFRAVKQSLKRPADFPLGRCRARPLRISGVGKQTQHTLFAKLRQTREIHHAALNRRIVNLEVARLDDDARR